MRKALVLGSALSALGLALAATPASAADTVITLSVGLDTPTLAIAAPAAVVVPGSPASATIATTVTDTRLAGPTGWVVSISSTALTLSGVGTPGAAGTIAATTMTASTGVITPDVLGTVAVTGVPTVSPISLSGTPQTFVTATSRANANVTAYTATLSIPTAGKTAGVYTGTVTQSVA
ncbi:MAG: hypothetical protein ABIO67_07650 [Mycobacteriales bacterium]